MPCNEEEIYRALVVDSDASHAACLIGQLRRRNVLGEVVESIPDAASTLRVHGSQYKLVIIHAMDSAKPWLAILSKLQEACNDPRNPTTPLFLFISNRRREPEFELAIEAKGVRYVYER